MKRTLFFIVFNAVAITIFAQANLHRCGTFDVMQYREQQVPGYMQGVRDCFNNAKQIANANSLNRNGNDTIYKVQLVFHVVYMDSIENIPDSVIFSQVEVLNEDYRRLNADTDRTRAEFLPVAGDARIEFELASVDPDGNPTNGITRTAGDGGFLGFNPFQENMKVEPGGKYPWPTDRYVNIWVCNVLNGLGILGYSYPPSNAPNWPAGSTTDSAKQGVVLHYPVVGRNFSQPIDPTVTKGRSLTHELGHYFGLRHIWGDSTGCNNDDGISDTPYASDASQQTCDTVVNSCPDAPTDFHDMIENYMDYSDDRCLNMFTVEQIGIMRAMLQTSRAGVAHVDNPATVKNVADKFELVQVFPNPSNGTLYLNVQIKQGNNFSYEIYNSVGEKLVAESQLNSLVTQRTINLAGYANGIYFAKISSGEQLIVKKFQLLR